MDCNAPIFSFFRVSEIMFKCKHIELHDEYNYKWIRAISGLFSSLLNLLTNIFCRIRRAPMNRVAFNLSATFVVVDL